MNTTFSHSFVLNSLEAEMLLDHITKQGNIVLLKKRIDEALQTGNKYEFIKCCQNLRRLNV